ncbi:MAG: hypothetical protein ABI601_08275 [bacterium]
MRTDLKVASLSLALALSACGRREEPTTALSDDLKRDLAVASSTAGDLATAPQSYQRMRFVSDVEQPKKTEPAHRPSLAKRPLRPIVRKSPNAQPIPEPARQSEVTTVAVAPAPAPATEAPIPEPVVIAQRPTPDYTPSSIPASMPSDGGIGERRRGGGVGGLGGILGGIIGGVVIRGGHGGVDKCDPRTDGRNRPPIFDQPNTGMPLPTGRNFPTIPMGRHF